LKSWSHYLPTRIDFGSGVLKGALQGILQSHPDAKRVLVITGQHHVKASGLGEEIRKTIKEAGKEGTLYSRVPPEPTVEAVEDTLYFAKGLWPHLVIGVGGGSPLDVAKVVSMMLINQKDLTSIIGQHEPFNRPGIPYIAIPTTSGSGSEVTPYSVVIDPSVPEKAPVISRLSFPLYAIDDPQLTLSCPPLLTARAGVDALSHCIEAYLSLKATPLSNMAALRGINLVFAHLPQAVREGHEIKARSGMMLASLLGGMAIAEAGAGLIHQLGHALAVFTGMPHGSTMALFMVPVLRFYGETIQHKLKQIALQAQVDPHQFLTWLQDWLSRLGLPTTLKESGYQTQWRDPMVDLVMSRKSVAESLPRAPDRGTLKALLDSMAELP